MMFQVFFFYQTLILIFIALVTLLHYENFYENFQTIWMSSKQKLMNIYIYIQRGCKLSIMLQFFSFQTLFSNNYF